MKKILTLSVMALLCAVTSMAQPPGVAVVEPGTKGALPQIPVIDTTIPEKQFNGLQLSRVFMSTVIYNGYFTFETYLSFPEVSLLGGEYYTLEYHGGTNPNDDWETYLDYDENPYHFTYNNAVVRIYNSIAQYRLRMHGGDMDGYTSNIVTAKHPYSARPTSYGGYSISGEDWFVLVGHEQLKNLCFSVTAYDQSSSSKLGTYDQDSEYIRYQWYRRNPYNWDMTPIAGATMLHYAPVVEDVGYELVLEISGDDEHCSFTYMYPLDIVKIPVCGYVSYYGPDGFVLNTDYVLTDPSKQLVFLDGMLEEIGPLEGEIVTKKPGQYVVYCVDDLYEYRMLDVQGNGYQLIFQYIIERGDETEVWMREAQLMPDRFVAPMTIKARRGGNSVPADIEIFGRNIEGEWVLKTTVTLDAQSDSIKLDNEAGLYTIGDGYILKAIPANNNLATTYYPNALLWSDAMPIYPGEKYDDVIGDWVTVTAEIDMQTVPTLSATGNGVIEGTVNGLAAARLTLGRFFAPQNGGTTATVFLKKKGGNIVAQTQTDATGKYRFERLPLDTYEVLVNIDGYTQQTITEVALTTADPQATGIDYTVSGSVITTGTIGDVNIDGAVDVADIGFVIDTMAKGVDPSVHPQADVNGDGVIDVADIAFIIDIMAKR